LPRLGSRVRIPSPAPKKSAKNQRQRCIFDGDVRASISLNEPRTVPSCLADLGKRGAKRSRNILDGPPPKRTPTSAATEHRAHVQSGPAWWPSTQAQPSARWMLLGLQSRLCSLVPPLSLTHAVNERERCPQAEVRASNPFGRANNFKGLEQVWAGAAACMSAECPRNPFATRSQPRPIAATALDEARR
jgi:hypothetical protein